MGDSNYLGIQDEQRAFDIGPPVRQSPKSIGRSTFSVGLSLFLCFFFFLLFCVGRHGRLLVSANLPAKKFVLRYWEALVYWEYRVGVRSASDRQAQQPRTRLALCSSGTGELATRTIGLACRPAGGARPSPRILQAPCSCWRKAFDCADCAVSATGPWAYDCPPAHKFKAPVTAASFQASNFFTCSYSSFSTFSLFPPCVCLSSLFFSFLCFAACCNAKRS